MRWRRIMGLTSLVLLLIPSFGIALAADVIYVSTDESYEPGDKVKVKGSTNVTGPVTVIITNNSGHKIHSQTVDPEDGKFTVSFKLDEDAEGTYKVNASVGNIYNTTSFDVVGDSDDGVAASDDGDETMTLEELLSAIDRAFRFIEKVNEEATALQKEGYDMTLFLKKLNWLDGNLTELSEDIGSVDLAASVEAFHDLRKEISQLSGLLSSITKNVKPDKALQFTERMMRRIGDLNGWIDGLGESTGVDELKSSLEAHQRKLERLWLTLNSTIPHDELEIYLKQLDGVMEDVDSGLGGLDGEGLTLKEMYKLQARIEVFNATVKRMEAKDKTMNKLQEKIDYADEQLDSAKELMMQMEAEFNARNWGKMKGMIGDVNEGLNGVGRTIREMNKSDKGGNGKSNGKGNGNGNGDNQG